MSRKKARKPPEKVDALKASQSKGINGIRRDLPTIRSGPKLNGPQLRLYDGLSTSRRSCGPVEKREGLRSARKLLRFVRQDRSKKKRGYIASAALASFVPVGPR